MDILTGLMPRQAERRAVGSRILDKTGLKLGKLLRSDSIQSGKQSSTEEFAAEFSEFIGGVLELGYFIGKLGGCLRPHIGMCRKDAVWYGRILRPAQLTSHEFLTFFDNLAAGKTAEDISRNFPISSPTKSPHVWTMPASWPNLRSSSDGLAVFGRPLRRELHRPNLTRSEP
jgi:hypothetical protein